MSNIVYIKCSRCNTTFPVNSTSLKAGLIQGKCIKCSTPIEFNYLGIPNNEQSPIMAWVSSGVEQPHSTPPPYQQPQVQYQSQPQQQYHQPYYTSDAGVIVKCKTLTGIAGVIGIFVSILLFAMGFVYSNGAKRTWLRERYDFEMAMAYYCFIAGGALLIWYIIKMMRWSSNELTLTNTRLYGRIKPGKLIDIPLNSIAHIEFKSGPTVFWHRLIITTPNEVIKIKYFDNLRYVYQNIINSISQN